MKVPFNINLSGKTAVVTGGSGTLCSAMAYGLAVCGAKVAIIGRNKEKLASVSEKLTKDALDEYNKNVIVKGYSCNVINKDELSAAYETIKNELGSCDILINGARLLRPLLRWNDEWHPAERFCRGQHAPLQQQQEVFPPAWIHPLPPLRQRLLP